MNYQTDKQNLNQMEYLNLNIKFNVLFDLKKLNFYSKI